jgi:hypothetical protein
LDLFFVHYYISLVPNKTTRTDTYGTDMEQTAEHWSSYFKEGEYKEQKERRGGKEETSQLIWAIPRRVSGT